MNHNLSIDVSLTRLNGCRFNTDEQAEKDRVEWLREIIGRQYANVEITPPTAMPLYNDMQIYPLLKGLRFSPIQSNAIQLERLPKEPTDVAHDCYFVVLLLSGSYKLEQGGRELFLKPGEMSIYDATEPHKITIPESFSKLIISVPRKHLDTRYTNVHKMTATKLASSHTSNQAGLFGNMLQNLHQFDKATFHDLSDPILDIVQKSLIENGAVGREISQFRALSLLQVKQYIHTHLDNDELDAKQISDDVRLSIRYINELFQSENTSVMRFVTQKRLERSCQYLSNHRYNDISVSDIAIRCGFKNFSHFSRVFKTQYLLSPRQYRQLKSTM